MSLPHPFNLTESQPEVRLETFEDLTTVRRVVGEVRGFDDPITTELRQDTQNSLSREGYKPKAYTGDEAKTIVNALKAVAKTREDELAISAADALKRMPLRLRAATFVTSIIKSDVPQPPPPQLSRGPRYPLFDPNATERRPAIEWKSKYDQSGNDTQAHKLA